MTTNPPSVDTFSEAAGRRNGLQRSEIGEPVKDLSVRLVRADGAGIDHHDGKIPRGRDAGIRGGDCDLWR